MCSSGTVPVKKMSSSLTEFYLNRFPDEFRILLHVQTELCAFAGTHVLFLASVDMDAKSYYGSVTKTGFFLDFIFVAYCARNKKGPLLRLHFCRKLCQE